MPAPDQSAIYNHHPSMGLSLLDLLIAVMVLTLVLLAAVYQFSTYTPSSSDTAPPAQSALPSD
jgi:Tfp pilus assembly protein PilV